MIKLPLMLNKNKFKNDNSSEADFQIKEKKNFIIQIERFYLMGYILVVDDEKDIRQLIGQILQTKDIKYV